MKIKLETFMAGGFFLFSLAYLAFVLSSTASVMIGDVRGYDPGSRAVPLLAAGTIGLLSLSLLIRQRRIEPDEGVAISHGGLILANIAVAACYIALFRPAGYCAATCLAMYWLIVLNLRTIGVRASWPRVFAWMIAAMTYLAACYTLVRVIIRFSFRFARSAELPLFREPAVHAVIAAAALGILFVLVGKVLRRLDSGHEFPMTLQTAVGTTMAIYVMFRLLFLVQLPAGLLNW